jgi:hypothetical protein
VRNRNVTEKRNENKPLLGVVLPASEDHLATEVVHAKVSEKQAQLLQLVKAAYPAM